MKYTLLFMLILSMFAAGGCSEVPKEMRIREKKAKPTFMFWCFRKEIVSDEFHVPEMKTSEAAAYIESRIKGLPGYEGSEYDLHNQMIKVFYQSTTSRKMNFEEAISQAGFAANHRPANPKAKIPEGVK